MSSVHGHKRLKTTTRFSRLSLQESTSVAVRVSKESFKVFLGFLGFIGFIGFFVQRPNTTQKHIRKKNITYMVMMYALLLLTDYSIQNYKHQALLIKLQIKNKKNLKTYIGLLRIF